MALGRELVRVLSRDAVVVVSHLRLFLGMLLALIGLLSFASDLYCDGNVSSYYACTRPSTYYYYPWWATLLIVLGVTLVVIWFLRQRTVRV